VWFLLLICLGAMLLPLCATVMHLARRVRRLERATLATARYVRLREIVRPLPPRTARRR